MGGGAELPVQFRGHLEGLRQGEIRFPRCADCGNAHWYPMLRCPHCLGREMDWKPVTGECRLYSWTVVMRTFSREFPPPYIVGLIEFPELPGIRLVSNVIDADASDLACGIEMRPVFSEDSGDVASVRFTRPRILPETFSTIGRRQVG